MKEDEEIFIEIKIGPLMETPHYYGIFPVKKDVSSLQLYVSTIEGIVDLINEEDLL